MSDELENPSFEELIHVYTIKDSLTDGQKIDLTSVAKKYGFICNVAITYAAYFDAILDIENVHPRYEEIDMRIKHLIEWFRCAVKNNDDQSEILFEFPLPVKGFIEKREKLPLMTLKAIFSPDFDGDMWITIMLPDED